MRPLWSVFHANTQTGLSTVLKKWQREEDLRKDIVNALKSKEQVN